MESGSGDLRSRLVAFYARYNPVRLQTLDEIIESWKDDEEGLFEALKEKYHLGEGDQRVSGSVEDNGGGESLTQVPPGLTPIQQLEHRCVQMERYLMELFTSTTAESHTAETTAANFRDTAAAFSEICLAILQNAKEAERRLASDREDGRAAHDATLGTGTTGHDIQANNDDIDFDGRRGSGTLEPLIHDVMPLDVDAVADKVISTVIRTKCKDGDILNIHPGVYRESILVSGLKLELRAASDLKDRPVVFVGADGNTPMVQVKGGGSLTLYGIEFTSASERSSPSVPLVTVDGGSQLFADCCAFIGGGGGIMAGDVETKVEVVNSTFRESTFAGVYAKGGARAFIRNCKWHMCEVGLRLRDAYGEVDASEFSGATGDGITCHGSCRALLSKVVFAGCKENGAMLSPSSIVSFQGCEFRGNGQYGVYVPAGAEYVADGCTFNGNNMGAYNRPPPLSSQLHAITRRLN